VGIDLGATQGLVRKAHQKIIRIPLARQLKTPHSDDASYWCGQAPRSEDKGGTGMSSPEELGDTTQSGGAEHPIRREIAPDTAANGRSHEA